MKRTIWKFDLAVTDYQQIIVPYGALPLSVGFQGTGLKLWAEINDPGRRLSVSLPVWVVGTGNPMPDMGSGRPPGAGYLGTAHDPRGFVWHIYIGEPK